MSAIRDKLLARRAAERKASAPSPGIPQVPAHRPYGFQVRPTPHQFAPVEAPVPVAAKHPEVQLALLLFWRKEAA